MHSTHTQPPLNPEAAELETGFTMNFNLAEDHEMTKQTTRSIKTLERLSLAGLFGCLATSLTMAAWTVTQVTLGA